MTIVAASMKIFLQSLMRKGACRTEASNLIGFVVCFGQRSFFQQTGLIDNTAHNIFHSHGIFLVLQKACNLFNNLSFTVFVLNRQSLGFFIGSHLHNKLQTAFQYVCQLLVNLIYFLADFF